MGSSGMAVDEHGKPIKRQNNNNKGKGGNNMKKNKNSGNGPQNRQQGGNNRGGHRGGPPRGPPMPIAPFGGPMNQGFGGMPPQFGGFFNNQNRRGGKNNNNRNGAPPSAYNGPSPNNVGQGAIGSSMNQPVQAFNNGPQEPAPVEVPGFGKNSNIHELFGKMIWRKMEMIQDPALVDQLQNRIMNLIHDALAGQNDQQQQQPNAMNAVRNANPFGPTAPQRGPAFGGMNAGFQRF